MKFIVHSIATMLFFSTVGLADHEEEIFELSHELTLVTYKMDQSARLVIAPRPSIKQRYAYEHMLILRDAAIDFERVRYQSSQQEGISNHNETLIKALKERHRVLRHDAFHAEKTLEKLFTGSQMGEVLKIEMKADFEKTKELIMDLDQLLE